VLVATTGVALAQAPTGAKRAAVDQRPALVKTIDGFGDWVDQWWDWAHKETARRTQPSSTTTPEPDGEEMASSPALPTSIRRPL
jgi:hypothetical protein